VKLGGPFYGCPFYGSFLVAANGNKPDCLYSFCFHQCEINGLFDNFALAAGLIKGEHKGDFSFDDPILIKIIEGAPIL
jgi:hypothetical protein